MILLLEKKCADTEGQEASAQIGLDLKSRSHKQSLEILQLVRFCSFVTFHYSKCITTTQRHKFASVCTELPTIHEVPHTLLKRCAETQSWEELWNYADRTRKTWGMNAKWRFACRTFFFHSSLLGGRQPYILMWVSTCRFCGRQSTNVHSQEAQSHLCDTHIHCAITTAPATILLEPELAGCWLNIS